jgi:hypothetical protein
MLVAMPLIAALATGTMHVNAEFATISDISGR